MELRRCARRVDDEDRISQLPLSVAVKILGFLSLKEAAQTSVLSKHWTRLWLCGNALDLDAYHVFDKDEDLLPKSYKLPQRTSHYVEWVTRVLRSRREALAINEELTKLRVRVNLGGFGQNQVDEWVSYAFASKVQSLELDLLNNSNPIVFVLDQLSFHPPLETPFNPLTSLRLSGVKVTDQGFQSLLKNLPHLQFFKVCASRALVDPQVCSPSPALKHLQILSCPCLRSATVRDTSLVSFTFTWIPFFVLENNYKLVDVRACDFPNDRVIAQMYQILPDLQSLTLYAAYDGSAKMPVPLLWKLKQLTLIIDPVQEEALDRLLVMLTSSPNLKKLALEFIYMRGYDKKSRVASEKRTLKKRPPFYLSLLKVFEVRGYYGEVAEDNLIKYLDEHMRAPKLRRVIFDPNNLGRDGDMPPLRSCMGRKERSAEDRAERFRRVEPSSLILS